MGDRRFDADNDKGRPDLGTLRFRELVDRVSGWCRTGALADRVVFEGTPDESVYNPIGMVHGGYVCTLADTVAACAVHTTLEAGTIYTSIDLNVSYTRRVTRDSGTLRAVGTVVKPGRRVAFCRADIVDGAGKIVATATSSCLVMPGAAAD